MLCFFFAAFGQLRLEAVLVRVLRDARRVVAAEAGVAAGNVAGERGQRADRQVAQGVGSDDLRDFFERVVRGDELVGGVDVRAVVAGMEEGRRGDAQVDLLGPRLADEVGDALARCAAHDGVVDEHDSLAANCLIDGVELDAHLVDAVLLAGRDEGAPDVLVLDEADAVGDARGAAVAERRVKPRVGHADDDVGIDGVTGGEDLAGARPRRVNGYAVDDGVGAREVDVLEDARFPWFRMTVLHAARHAVLREDEDLAGQEVALQLCADGAQGAALRGDDPRAVGHPAVAERTEALRVAHGDELRARHEAERVGALQAIHRLADRLFDGTHLETRLRDEVGDDLRVDRRVEDGAGEFELVAQQVGVAQVAVVRERHLPLLVIDGERLAVASACRACRAVAYMTDGNLALGEAGKNLAGKDIVDESEILVRGKDAVIVHGDAAALLPAVLQRVKGVVGHRRDVRRLGRKYAEYTAFFMYAHSSSSLTIFLLW